jgi:hypothetical protein
MPHITVPKALLPAVIGAMLVVSGGCKREAPVNGIGGFQVGKTKLGQIGGRCIDASEQPLMFCPSLASVMLGDHRANIDLYFADKHNEATLAEILLDVNACRPDALGAWLADTLGKAVQQAERRMFWSNDHVFIAAALPAEPGRCEINFVAAGDTARIERLQSPPR